MIVTELLGINPAGLGTLAGNGELPVNVGVGVVSGGSLDAPLIIADATSGLTVLVNEFEPEPLTII